MSELHPPGASSSPAPDPGPEDRGRLWWIVVAVAVGVGLAAGLAFVLVRDDDGPTQDAADSATSGSTITSITPAAPTTPAPTASSDGGPDCSAEAVLAAASEVAAADATVAEFACDLDGGWAWARLEAPAVDALVVFYVSSEGGGTDWLAVSWGSDVVCEEALPPEACDRLPGAP